MLTRSLPRKQWSMPRGTSDSGHRTFVRVRGIVASFVCLLLAVHVSSAQCAGDCGADGQVSVEELVAMANVTLGLAAVLACPAGDADIDGLITVDEIIGAVSDALGDCNAPQVRRTFDFRGGRQGWEAGFADYAPEMVETLELEAGPRVLPPELGLEGPGFVLSGANRSDDLFMFLKRRLTNVDGVLPDRAYSVEYAITFASAAPTGCSGIGGSPGESVYLKAGAASVEPLVLLDDADNHLRMNIDKGNQALGGRDASLVSDVANGRPCESGDEPFVSLRRHHVHIPEVTASAEGELWVLLGTDSGFEGTTTLYYQRIEVTLTPLGDFARQSAWRGPWSLVPGPWSLVSENTKENPNQKPGTRDSGPCRANWWARPRRWKLGIVGLGSRSCRWRMTTAWAASTS